MNEHPTVVRRRLIGSVPLRKALTQMNSPAKSNPPHPGGLQEIPGSRASDALTPMGLGQSPFCMVTGPRVKATDGDAPVEGDEHSLTIGPGSPVLFRDRFLIEQGRTSAGSTSRSAVRSQSGGGSSRGFR